METEETLDVLDRIRKFRETSERVRSYFFDFLEKKTLPESVQVSRPDNQVEMYGVKVRIVIEVSVLPNEPKVAGRLMAHRLKENVNGEKLPPEIVGEPFSFDARGRIQGMAMEGFPPVLMRQLLEHFAKETFTF